MFLQKHFSVYNFRSLFRVGFVFTALFYILTLSAPAALAKTYVITDGDRTITYTTFATDPATVPDRADIEPEIHGNDTTHDNSIAIRRAMEIRLRYRGTTTFVTSTGETVGQLLTRLGLDITDQDVLSHPADAFVTDDMDLIVDSVITRQETYSATIPYEITRCLDHSLPEGTEEILIPGRDGELKITAEVTYVNGIEQNRTILSETQTIAPIDAVIAQGTAIPKEPEPLNMPIIEDGYITMPSGEVLTYYKTDYVTATGYTHTDAGCDMITSTGTTVHYGTVAVDPRFIPYGTRMLIVSHDGERYYGIATAEDCGGAIKRDKMDLYFPTHQECIEFGRRRCTIYFLG